MSKELSQDSKKMKNNVHVTVTLVDWQQTLNSIVNIWVGKSILLVGVNSKMSNFTDHIWKNERKCLLQKQNRKQCNRNPWTEEEESSRVTHYCRSMMYGIYLICARVKQSSLWISSEKNWEENKLLTVYGWIEVFRQRWGDLKNKE